MNRFFLYFLLSTVFISLISCSDLTGSIGKDEIRVPQNGIFVDTVLTASKDSSYRHLNNSMGGGFLYLGSYRGMEASTLFRFNSFGSLDSLYLDTVQVDSTHWTTRYDSVRVESASLILHRVTASYGFLSDGEGTVDLEIWQPDAYWTQSSAIRDTLINHAHSLNVTIPLPLVPVGKSDSIIIRLPTAMIPTIQHWVTIRTNYLVLSDTNWGIWLRPTRATGMYAFNSRENYSYLQPKLQIIYSKMRGGQPVGAVPDTFASRVTDDISCITQGSTPLNGLQLGSGDAVRGLVWFDMGDLINRQVNVHKAKLVLTRNHNSNDFGSIVALAAAVTYNDSISWAAEPSIASVSSAYFGVTDSTVEIDVSNNVARWLALQKPVGAILLYDSWEGFAVSRTNFGSVSAGGVRPRLEITMSRLERVAP